MNEQQAINSVENHINSLGKKSIESLTSYGTTHSTNHLNNFNKKGEVIYNMALARATRHAKKFARKEVTREVIIEDALIDLSGLKLDTSTSFATNMMNFLSAMTKAIWKSISNLISKIVSAFQNPGGLLANLTSFATGLFNAIVGKLKSIVSGIIASFMKTLTGMFNSIIGRIMSIKNMILGQIKSVKDKFDALKKNANDFYKRAKGLSSTAQEIQAKKPTIDGNIKPNPEALKGSVQDKIITPQLKADVQKAITFEVDPLAKLLGFLGSLIPKVDTKKIAEPKPTGDKAEYGKIVANVNKAGFTKISDSTPGNVREVNMHPTGTYNAMLDDGSCHTKTTGDKQEITDGNWNITTSKDKVEIVVGDSKIEIRKNFLENIIGDHNLNLQGVQNSVVTGDVSDDYKANYTGKINGDYTENVAGNKSEKTSGTLTETIGGSHKETVTGSFTIHVTGNVNIISGGNASLTAKGLVAINGSKVMLG